MPSFEDIQKKQLQIKEANEHNLTHQEVDEMVKIKKELRNSTFLLEKTESSLSLQKESSSSSSSIKQQEGKNLKSIDIFNKALPILETGRVTVKKRSYLEEIEEQQRDEEKRKRRLRGKYITYIFVYFNKLFISSN